MDSPQDDDLPQLDPTAKVMSAEDQKNNFLQFADDCARIRDNVIPSKKVEAREKEIRLRKITGQLKAEGYTQSLINKIFQYHASEELFDDIVKKYDDSGKPEPNVDDIGC